MQENVITITSNDELTLIQQYLHLFRGVYGLTDKQIVAVSLLIRDARKENGSLKAVLNSDGRARLRDELDLTEGNFNTLLHRLKQKNVIKDGELTSLAKGMNYDETGCKLVVNLKLVNANKSQEVN